MKDTEARDLVVMLAAATSTRLIADEKAVWEAQLTPLDADLASKAVLSGRNTWTRFPSWAQFREAYNAQRRAAQVAEQEAQVAEEGKRGLQAPEWVHIWWFCRRVRDPRELASFPQQHGFVDPGTVMSRERYMELHQEWLAAGMPRARVQDL